jgi:hypothetical protein
MSTRRGFLREALAGAGILASARALSAREIAESRESEQKRSHGTGGSPRARNSSVLVQTQLPFFVSLSCSECSTRTKLRTSTHSNELGRAVSPCAVISSRAPLSLAFRRNRDSDATADWRKHENVRLAI